MVGQIADPGSDVCPQSSDAENMPTHSSPDNAPSSTASAPRMRPQGPAAQQTSRIPMTGLSQNSQYTPSAANRVLPPMMQSKIPERPTSYLASLRSSGNTTHRDSRPSLPGMWQFTNTSGALTARGKVLTSSWLVLISTAKHT